MEQKSDCDDIATGGWVISIKNCPLRKPVGDFRHNQSVAQSNPHDSVQNYLLCYQKPETLQRRCVGHKVAEC